jgi:hypothetical protein
MKIKKNGVTLNLTESDIKKLSKSILKEQTSKEAHDLFQKHSTPPNQKKINQKDKVIHSELEKRVVELEEQVKLLHNLVKQNTQLSVELKKSLQTK